MLIVILKMVKQSAGIVLYRFQNKILQVMLVHPGGPFWAKKDAGVWSVPKGEVAEGEDLFMAAKRELQEETGITVEGNFLELTPVKQKVKWVFAWAVEYDFEVTTIHSNSFEMEWPPRSGQKKSFPEIDKAAWFTVAEAKLKIINGQIPLLDELAEKLLSL